MSNQTKPVKRSKQLAPLSREHHEGLLLGWKIRQGLKNGTDIKRIAQFVQWFWESRLQEHFREEEEILAARLPENDALVQRMIDEHQNIEALVHINANIADEALLLQLADAVSDHIRFEERAFFPYAEKMLSIEQLNLVYGQLSKEHKTTGAWKDEFWAKK